MHESYGVMRKRGLRVLSQPYVCVCGGVALCGKPFPGTQIGGGMSQSLLGSLDSGRFHHCQLQTDSDWRHQWTHGEM